MFAIGCLLLLILPIAGLLAGVWLGSTQAAIAGALIGFAVAAVGCAIPLLALVKARRN